MRPLMLPALFFIANAALAQGVDPASSLDQGRKAIAEKRYKAAIEALEPAREMVAAIRDETERRQALAAIHFYLAAAHSGAGNEKEAREHLKEFFERVPNARRIDANKYQRRFVALFNELSSAATTSPSSAESFDAFYPGFDSYVVPEKKAADERWGTDSAVEVLASKAEKREWLSIASREERQKFVEDFWQRRDPDPQTPGNEFEETFNRRLAFSETAFPATDGSATVSDRGRVFVLLGAPAFIRRLPITNRDRIVIYENAVINGTIEHWVYTREQLPMKLAKETVQYRFVTQRGIGDGVLQREDVYAMQALAVATNPHGK